LRLVVGLGNPGPEYAETRHNAGFWFCERLARELGAQFARESRYHGLVAKARVDGRAVQALAHFYRISPAEMLVAHDELDLPPGQMRLKFGGGLGGHNGLKDITSHLGTQDYWRLRLGIGHPGDRNLVTDFVLKRARREEQDEIDVALDRALLAWPLFARGEFNAATQKINTVPKAAPKEE
jgi:PTH1 family peptidyl-tRNA hydrolase